MIALFAPCCITFLFPAYLGQIVRTRTKIFLGTIIFSFGIATIILPLTIGLKVILNLFWQYHSFVYYTGAFLMIVFGFLVLFGKNLMKYLPHLPQRELNAEKIEFGSLYTLGLVSGLSSACCAPVLGGAIVLAGISPTLVQTLLVGLSYVAGMVFPLFIGALFIGSNPLTPIRKFFNRRFGNYTLGNIISAFVFILMGLWILWLNLNGKIAMGVQSQKINQIIGNLNVKIGGFLSQYRIFDWVLGILLFLLIIKIIKSGIKKNTSK